MRAEPPLRALDLEGPGGAMSFPAVWLRDNCPCPACTDPGSGQKLHSVTDLPLGTAISSSELGDSSVTVEFAPDGHRGVFAMAWLRAHAPDGQSDPDVRTAEAKILWRGADDAGGPPEVDWARLLVDDGHRERCLSALLERGVVLVRGVPVEPASVLVVASELGYVRETNYRAPLRRARAAGSVQSGVLGARHLTPHGQPLPPSRPDRAAAALPRDLPGRRRLRCRGRLRGGRPSPPGRPGRLRPPGGDLGAVALRGRHHRPRGVEPARHARCGGPHLRHPIQQPLDAACPAPLRALGGVLPGVPCLRRAALRRGGHGDLPPRAGRLPRARQHAASCTHARPSPTAEGGGVAICRVATPTSTPWRAASPCCAADRRRARRLGRSGPVRSSARPRCRSCGRR